MAEKEERILIDVINPGINCVYRLDNDPKGQSLCKHNGNMEPVTAKECRHCDEGMTRQEAINLIDKVLEEGFWSGKTFRQLSEDALNALLEETK